MTVEDLVYKLISINDQIDALRAEKRQIEKEIKQTYDKMVDLCGKTGKTRKEV